MRTYNRYPSEEEAQEAFATFCGEQVDCEHCPLHRDTIVPGSDRLVPGGLAEKSCAIHWLYSRFAPTNNRKINVKEEL